MAFGWKVVTRFITGELVSANWDVIGKWSRAVTYTYGEFVFPVDKDKPLAVSATYEGAEYCQAILGLNRIILPCEYIPSDKLPEWAYWAKETGFRLYWDMLMADAVRIF